MKIRYVPFLLILTIPIFVAAQLQRQDRIDSLENQLKKNGADLKEKDKLLNLLWETAVDTNPDKAMNYANEIIKNAKITNNDTALALGFTRKGICYSYSTNYKLSNPEYRKALGLYRELQDTLKIGYIFLNLGLDFSEQDIMDSTLYFYDKALINFTAVKDTVQISKIKRYIADTYGKKGYYEIGLQKALDAARLLEKSQDSFEIHMSYFGIASFYHELKDSLSAENYLRKISSFFEKNKNPRWESTAKLRLAALFLDSPDKYNEALALVDKGVDLSKDLNFKINIADGLLTKGLLLARMGKYEEAEKITKEALTYSRPTNINHSISRSLVLLGELSLQEKDYSKSQAYFKEGLEVAENAGLLTQQKDALMNLAKVNQSMGASLTALKYHQLFKEINDSIFQKERINKVEEWKLIYETEKKEAEIALQEEEIKTLNEKARGDKLQKGLYAGGMASALALFGLSVFGFRQRIKKNRIAREKQEEIYKHEIEHKQKELASQTLHLVQKNTFIQELKENLENLKNSPEKFKAEFRRIVMLLKKENASDKDWEVFKTYFADVHNDFDQKLKTLYADISEKEIRLAAFLRMNLTTKEIAATLNVLPDSILKSKYRLKKKLGLDKETDLNRFLSTL
ncbi:MAG: tetratricopeptide repeat protein [Bacteroidota bacterium]